MSLIELKMCMVFLLFLYIQVIKKINTTTALFWRGRLTFKLCLYSYSNFQVNIASSQSVQSFLIQVWGLTVSKPCLRITESIWRTGSQKIIRNITLIAY